MIILPRITSDGITPNLIASQCAFRHIESSQNKIARQADCFILAGVIGLEPTANGFGDRYSTN